MKVTLTNSRRPFHINRRQENTNTFKLCFVSGESFCTLFFKINKFLRVFFLHDFDIVCKHKCNFKNQYRNYFLDEYYTFI